MYTIYSKQLDQLLLEEGQATLWTPICPTLFYHKLAATEAGHPLKLATRPELDHPLHTRNISTTTQPKWIPVKQQSKQLLATLFLAFLQVNELLQRHTISLEARLLPDYVVHRHVNLATNTSSD
jgi:hypothetical protein